MDLTEVGRIASAVVDEVEKAVVGKRDALELLLLGLLADGHVLLEDYPGLAKTLMARSFAQVCSMDFSRIQFTPDLMPSDVTGLVGVQPARRRLPVPAGPDLRQPAPRRRDQPRAAEDAGGAARGDAGAAGDDRGRDAPARPAVPRAWRRRTRSSTRGHTPSPRRSSTGSCCACRSAIPSAKTNGACSPNARSGERTRCSSHRSSTARPCSRCSSPARTCSSPSPVGLYMVDVVAATRNAPSIQVGASPRGSLALLKLSRCRAALDGRDYVTPDDVKADRGACARPSPHAAPRAVGAADLRRGRRAGAPRDRRRRRSPRTSPRT